MFIRKIYHTLTAILSVQEEIRDLLRLHQSQAEATYAHRRRPEPQSAVLRPVCTGRKRNKPYIALQTISRHFGITDRDLKAILVKNGVKYGTDFFKKAGYKGHVQSMIQEKDYDKVKTALENEGYFSKRQNVDTK